MMVICSVVMITLIAYQMSSAQMAGSLFIYDIDPIIPVLPLAFVIFYFGVLVESRSKGQAAA